MWILKNSKERLDNFDSNSLESVNNITIILPFTLIFLTLNLNQDWQN